VICLKVAQSPQIGSRNGFDETQNEATINGYQKAINEIRFRRQQQQTASSRQMEIPEKCNICK